MVPKPPVDIEWYDDGFSIEEQRKLAQDYIKMKAASRPKIKVTEEYHEKTKDRIISDLRTKLAANEEYIKELEEGVHVNKVISDLEKALQYEKEQREILKSQYTTLNQKYVNVLNNPDLGVQKYRDTIKDLEKEVSSLRKVRDELIGKLNKCTQLTN